MPPPVGWAVPARTCPRPAGWSRASPAGTPITTETPSRVRPATRTPTGGGSPAMSPASTACSAGFPASSRPSTRCSRPSRASQGRWWVPSWVNGGVNGFACATGLVQMLNFSDQYLEFEAPQGGGDTPGHQVDGQILADIARADLVLPKFTVHTNPPPRVPSDVNLPVWVWVTYNGARSPTDTATVPTPAGALWARVTTSQPQVSISVSSPGQARVYNQCGAAGSPYQGNA